jgi:DNA-binding MarR family transcriptional regulator
MPLLLLKNLPRYECILQMAQTFPDLDPSACEAYLHLLRTADEIYRVREANHAAHGLSQGRFTVLMLLFDKAANRPKPSTPAELAESAGVTRATMTGLIDTLERDGLVKREPDPHDRRMMSVHLTDRGLGMLQEVLPGHFQWMSELMAPLDEAERKTLVRLLAKIAARAPEAPKARAAAGAA